MIDYLAWDVVVSFVVVLVALFSCKTKVHEFVCHAVFVCTKIKLWLGFRRVVPGGFGAHHVPPIGQRIVEGFEVCMYRRLTN